MKRISDLVREYVSQLACSPYSPIELGESDKESDMTTYTDTHDKFQQCPRCSGFIPNNVTPGAYPGAISRLDNKTEICSDCGSEEAMLDWQHRLTDWRKK
jgi:ribosomal protein S27AE